MSKAEEIALNKYPIANTGLDDINYLRRLAFIEGYHQAEKDLKLTLEDVEIIINAFLDFCIENKERGNTKRYTNKEYSQEVLKRFKNMKDGSKG